MKKTCENKEPGNDGKIMAQLDSRTSRKTEVG